MKEVTYEDWQKNTTPRVMWCWDDEEEKVKRKVIYVVKSDFCHYPVRATTDDTGYEAYRHCAEIEKQRRMTKKELARWLREKPTREFKYNNHIGCSVFSFYTYDEYSEDEEVRKDILIREDDGEWREPLVEVGE